MVETALNYLKDHAFNVVLIIILSMVARRILSTFVADIVGSSLKKEKYGTELDLQKRKDTLVNISNTIIRIAVLIVAGLLILSELGINIAPLLASAGIIGVALGFGMQSLVKDVVSGFFILVENQYRIDDVVQINQEVSGTVEDIGLRTTILRDIDGNVHHIPNGIIEIATNKTTEFTEINMDINIAYDTDIDKLEKIINEVGEKLAKDEQWKDKILEAPQFQRINDFADSAMIVKISGTTKPNYKWGVSGELRRRLKNSFDKNNIEIPYPQTVIHQAKDKKPSSTK